MDGRNFVLDATRIYHDRSDDLDTDDNEAGYASISYVSGVGPVLQESDQAVRIYDPIVESGDPTAIAQPDPEID